MDSSTRNLFIIFTAVVVAVFLFRDSGSSGTPAPHVFGARNELAASNAAASAAPDEVRYEGVWESGERTSLTTAPLSRAAFLETGDALVGNGLRLFDVETRVIDGRRAYAGLWTEGTGGNIFAGPMGPVDMREEMEARRAQGFRLIDFEIFRRSNGGRQYLGVWRTGPGEELLTGPMEIDAFKARGDSLISDGFRLWDVEVENHDGRILYSGLFRSGAGLNAFIGPLSRQAFRTRRDQMVADGLELRDIERIEINGRQRFVTVWSSGDGESRLSRLRPYGQYFAFSQDQYNDGKRATDFEIRVAETKDGDGTGGTGGAEPGPSPVADLDPNPPYIELVDGQEFRIDWSVIIGGMPRIEIPADYLPDYLPLRDGEKLLPTGSACGFILYEADAAFWQIPGDPEFDDEPFNAVPDIEDEGFEFYANGVKLWGPILGCDSTQQQWGFPFPLTTHEIFNPQEVENLSLVVEWHAAPGTDDHGPRIGFTPPQDNAEPFDVDELWDDEWIEDLMEWTEEVFEAGAQQGEYCNVSSLIVKICEENPGICPVPDPQGNC